MIINMKYRHIAVGATLAWLASATLLYAQNYNVSVQAGAKQTFAGFGASQTSDYTDTKLPAAMRNQMASLFYTGLHAKVLRLWVSAEDYADVTYMTNEFYPKYVSCGAISNIVADGVTTLLLAPGSGGVVTTNVVQYASRLAQFIYVVKTTWGINISVTGLNNEPGWATNQIADGVADLRADLDGLGLTNVQIVAPEAASADGSCDAEIDAIYNKITAWNGLTGIASHSYNMAARANEANRTHGKQYWITEASADGNEQVENGSEASSIAARFLNDMNHMVTDWVFFIGFGDSVNVTTDTDSATKTMVYDQATGTIQIFLKYYYFQQLLTTFDYGAVFRSCTSSSEGDMVYTYGQKPRINVAAAVNPDGSWGIGIQNDTGVTLNNPPLAMWYAAINTNVTVTVSELVGTGNQNFTLYHSMPGAHFVNDGTVTMTNGTITVAVAAEELVCLRSVASGPPPSVTIAYLASSNSVVISWPTTPGGALESSDSLNVPDWSGVTNPVVVVGNTNTVLLGVTGNAKYFRLHPAPPAAPTNLVATAGNAQVTLSWSASSGATNYNVYRGTSSGGENGTPIATGITTTGYTDTGLANGTTYYYTVAAVNGGGTSGYSSEASATPSVAIQLSGSVAAAASSYNLTTLGTSDWAHWNGTFIHKSTGGTQISNVTPIGGGTYGIWSDASRSVTWSDGTPTNSTTSDHGYIWCNGTANSGWTFTVPAGTNNRTLHVVCGGPANAAIKLTAHLSDGSAADYTDTETSTSMFTKEYTITYEAASATQTLTITIIHTNSSSPSCDLDAAWLP
jgi:hypothetical protein